MPVTTYPAPEVEYTPFVGGARGASNGLEYEIPQSTKDMLDGCAHRTISARATEIFQSTFDDDFKKKNNSEDSEKGVLWPLDQGFVRAAVNAYSNHNHLIIRPDDIWHSILVQFNLFVNGHAEEMRKMFVAHEGKKKLVVRAIGNRYTVDFGQLAQNMAELVDENVVDKELKDWFLPDFSTTEDNDKVVASVVLMATLKKYFDYGFQLCCGLPAVTLLGEKKDWERLLDKVSHLPRYGQECTDWCDLLKPVCRRFIQTFDEPESEEVKNFWQSIAHHQGGGSGPRYISGWIVAFSFFDLKGRSLYHVRSRDPAKPNELIKPTETDVSGRDWDDKPRPEDILKLDGVIYHRVNTNNIPPGCAEVPVELDDNGEIFDCMMVAGITGVRLTDSGKTSKAELKMVKEKQYVGYDKKTRQSKFEEVEVERTIGIDHDGTKDVVQPAAGWFMFSVKP